MRWTPDFPPLSLSSRKLANQTTPLTWKRWGPGPDYYGLWARRTTDERPPNTAANPRRTPPRTPAGTSTAARLSGALRALIAQ